MPLVEIRLNQPLTPQARQEIGEAVHHALIDALGIPADDHFQIFCSTPDQLIYDPGYLGIARTDAFMIVQIFLARGRTMAQKKSLYKRLAELLASDCDVRPEDVFVNLVEVGPEDFSFGAGLAQYADVAPAHLAAGVSAAS